MKEYRTIREVNGPLMVVDQVEVEVASTEVEPLTKQVQVEEVGTLETLYLVIK